MATQPLLATERVGIHYRSDSLTHVMHVLCDATSHTPAASHDLLSVATGTIDADTAIQALAAQLAATLLTTDSVDDYVLEHFVDGAYIPIQSGTIGLAGAQSAAGTPYGRITGFYRDLSHDPVKIVVITGTYFLPFHTSPSALPSPFDDFWLSFVLTATGQAGDWARSKSDDGVTSATAVTGSLDRTTRRRAGLV